MKLDENNPRHIAITPDWNRRRARNRKMPDLVWHREWYEKIKKVIWWANDRVIECLTVWWLSKENVLERNQEEIKGLLKLVWKLNKLLPMMQKENIKFINIWDIELFSPDTQKLLKSIEEQTISNTWMKLVIWLWYSWLDEITRATKKIVEAGLSVWDINENEFKKYLDGWLEIPDPDLIIRTWIHNWTECYRHSWIHLARSTSSEYFFTKTLWPDFNEFEFQKAIEEFMKTKRTKWK